MLIYIPYKSAIVAVIAALLLLYIIRYLLDKVFVRHKHCDLIACALFALPISSFIFGVYLLFGATHTVPLGEVPNSIDVEGNIVTIHDLPDGYAYNSRNLSGKEPIKFKYSYDEEFKTGILEELDGSRYELSDEDSDYIKSGQKG